MTLHDEGHDEHRNDGHAVWTDQLSDYLDDELTPEEHEAVESHLRGCDACTAVLDELKQVVSRARMVTPRPPQADLWPGIADRLDGDRMGGNSPAASILPMRTRAGWRVTFTLPQLAAAAVLIAAVSGGLVWSLRNRTDLRSAEASRSTATADRQSAPSPDPAVLQREASAERSIVPVSLADAQYDAAVTDLERALKDGRGKLDPTTITIVEHNLQTIDEAIRQAREALAADPANSYLSGHLVEARRRKLDLLRRAAALTSESD
jgi:anti-sigma factor RsiW